LERDRVEEHSPNALRFGDYLFMVRRRAGLVLVTVTVFLLTALAINVLTTPSYEASAEVAVDPVETDLERQLFGTKGMERQLRLATEPEVVRAALARLGLPAGAEAAEDFSRDRLDVEALDDSLLEFTVTDRDAEEARALTQALVDAYLAAVKEEEKQLLEKALEVLGAQQAVAVEQLASLDGQLASEPGAVASSLELERDQTYAKLRELAASMTELQSASQIEDRAELIEPVAVPDAPASPRSGLNLVLGLVLGVATGLSLALGLESRRAAQSDDQIIESLGAGPVLAHLEHESYLPPTESAARGATDALRALRAVLLSGADPRDNRPLRMAAIATGEAAGTSQNALALAALLARSGRRVLFLDAVMHDMAADLQARPQLPYVDLADLTSDDSAAARTCLTELEPRLYALSFGASRPELADCIDAIRLDRLVRRLAGDEFDVIASATMSPVGLELAAALGQVLLLVRSGSLADEQTQRALSNVQRIRTEFVGSAVVGANHGTTRQQKRILTPVRR
jgi:capsular polysaccharide biosynthesis protein